MSKSGSAVGPLRVLLVATLAVPVALFAIVGWLTYHSAFKNAERNANWIGDVAREHAAKVLDSQKLVADWTIEFLKDMDDAEVHQSEQALHETLTRLVSELPQVQSFIVLGRDGHPLVSTASFPVRRDLDFTDRDYFQALSAGMPGTYISRIQENKFNRQLFFGLGRRRETEAGGFNGLVDIAISPLFFFHFYQTLIEDNGPYPGEEIMSMVRDDGQFLVRYPFSPSAPPQLPPTSPFFDAIRHNPEGGIYINRSMVDTGSPERIFAYRKIAGYPVYVVVGRSVAAVIRDWQAKMASYLAIGLPATAILILVTWTALARALREEAALIRARTEMQRREAAEDALRQSQKMDAIGKLTGGIAHDFNNLLTAVLGGIDTLRQRVPLRDAKSIAAIDMVQHGAERAAALTHRLLAFSRQQALDPKPVDANQLVCGMSELLDGTLDDAITVKTILPPGLWQTRADPNQLENAILNLAINARDAMPNGGKVIIETANIHLDEVYAQTHDEVLPGQYVVIAVTDTGTGMAAEVVDRAFDPFFTTKGVGMGTGLGLSQVYGFVKQSSGHVKIYSEPGQGTSVKLYLPRWIGSGEVAAEPSEPAPATITAQGTTILAVEDDEIVRLYTSEVLRDLGYDVLESGTAEDALGLIEARPDICLLFTDVGLPGDMNGRELADEATRRRPDLKVLFTTGYARNAIVHNGMLDPGVQLIAKPFRHMELAAKIAAVLDGSSLSA